MLIDIRYWFTFLSQYSLIVKPTMFDIVLQRLMIDQTVLKYALSLIIACPLGYALRLIPRKYVQIKHTLSMLVGIVFMQWVFGPDWIHSFVSSAISYGILSSNRIPARIKTYLNTFWVLSYLFACHGYHMYYHYMSSKLDFRNTQMILTIKLTSLGWNLYDGSSECPKTSTDPREERELRDRTRYAIGEIPSLIEFFGFVYCFPFVMVGPSIEFKDYMDAMTGAVFRGDNSITMDEPSSLLPGILLLAQGLVFLPIHLFIEKHFQLERLSSPDVIGRLGPLSVYAYIWCTMLGLRSRFYFAWKVSQAAATLAGFGFVGNDSEGAGKLFDWRGVENMDIMKFETAASMSDLTRAWNQGTQRWLERYVYQRSFHNLSLTYVFSALWHGFYPGYFIFFALIACKTIVQRALRQHLNPLLMGRRGNAGYMVEFAYWQICRIVVCLGLHITTPFFFLRSWDKCVLIMRSFHYIPYIALLFVTLASLILNSRKRTKIANEKRKGA